MFCMYCILYVSKTQQNMSEKQTLQNVQRKTFIYIGVDPEHLLQLLKL